MRDRYYKQKKKVLVVCLAGARLFLQAEKKKVLVVCLAGARSVLREEKKNSSRLSGGCTINITTGKKKFKSSVWWVRDRYYEPKIKTSSCLAGGCAIVITSGKKKVQVVCLAGARSLLRPEKKKFKSTVWRVRDCYYERKKRSSS